MVSALISRIVILVFGTLYPAYASYKAIRTKNVKEYVKWMMYWIVFALFCAVETFSDVFISWFPFYYELKIVFVIWLLSPVTKGSNFLYKKFVHPQLTKREKEIDECISRVRTRGYSTLLHFGTRGLSLATNIVVEGAIKGRGKLVDHIRKSYSTSDLRIANAREIEDEQMEGPTIIEDEDELDNRILEDNRELENRRHRRSKLIRSTSDVSDNRRHGQDDPDKRRYSKDDIDNRQNESDDNRPLKKLTKSSSGLQILPEEEEPEQTITEEFTVNKYGTYTRKEISRDPYATLPRTRTRNRPRLNNN